MIGAARSNDCSATAVDRRDLTNGEAAASLPTRPKQKIGVNLSAMSGVVGDLACQKPARQ